MKITLALFICIVFTACGRHHDSKPGEQPQEEAFTEIYSADLAPVNDSGATGNARVNILNDNLQVNVTFNNGDNGIHPQHIQVGTRCPVLEKDDDNHNGKIDPDEAIKAYGESLVSLGKDLVSNNGGFPDGSNYKYDALGSLSQLLGNLNIAKLVLEGHVVSVLGFAAVGAAIPVACGVLKRVQ
jgi:hypothetical protein